LAKTQNIVVVVDRFVVVVVDFVLCFFVGLLVLLVFLARSVRL